MPTDVIMPALGMAQEAGKVVRWLRAEGDAVAKGEPLLEIETDKVTVELEAPADGTLAGILAVDGDEVPVGQAIAVLLAAGEQVAEKVVPASTPVAAAPRLEAAPRAESPPAPAGPQRRALASPKARRLAAERGVDVAALAGSGPGGVVVAADVGGNRAAPVARSSTWTLMAERATRSWQSVPHFYLRRAVNATELESARAAARARPETAGVSHTDLLVALVAKALRTHPAVNAVWEDGTPAPSAHVNVAIAVATADALVAPVIHDADRLGLAEIAARRSELAGRAREGGLRPDDVRGGTFTISNLGMFGVDSFDAIVNAPQVGILAVGRIRERIVPVGGLPIVRPELELTLSFDHRAVDGARGAEFLDTLAGLLEAPAPSGS